MLVKQLIYEKLKFHCISLGWGSPPGGDVDWNEKNDLPSSRAHCETQRVGRRLQRWK